MNGLDLFSGIGGITKTLDGYVRPVAYCENDRYAAGVLLSRMADGSIPVAPIWDDVRTLRGDMLPPINIIYGGFPCQNISVAGRGEGLAGEQSGLFFEIVRLVRELLPRFVFLENTTAINLRGLERIHAEFELLNYECRGMSICASSVGAPMHGHRWFFLAKAKGLSGNETDSQKNSIRIAGRTWAADMRRNWKQMASPNWTIPKAMLLRDVDGLPGRVDAVRALGNAVVPAQAREAFKRLCGLE